MKALHYQRQTSNVATGTSFQGHVYAKYSDLVSAFGTPELDRHDKTPHLWVISIEGVICTIYDYKDNLETDAVEAWHIGGFVPAASLLVNEALAQNS